MNNNQKVAVVGCGYWGKNLVRNFSSLGALAAVCDLNSETALTLGLMYQVPSLEWGAILEDTDITGVVIAAPAFSHTDLVLEALNADKDVFVEKPLSLCLASARKAVSLAKSKQKILMVGHLLQYHPAFLRLKEIVDQGGLGDLQYVYSNRLNLGKVRREEDILWSFAPHDLSMILGLVGEQPSKVTAVGGSFISDKVADTTTTHMEFPSGVQAHVFVSWLHPFKEQKLVVVGSKAMAVFDDTKPWAEKLVIYPHKINLENGTPILNKAEAQIEAIDALEPLKNECQHFLNCLSTREAPRTDGEEGLSVLTVLQQATQSLDASLKLASVKKSPDSFVHESSCIDEGVKIGAGTKIWHFSHIMANVSIGSEVVIGQNVMVGSGVKIGNHCKVQNNVSLYQGVVLEDGVFCGPSCVFTNVNTPRSEVERKNEFLLTVVERGATIGANATIVCGNRLGAYCLIGAGAVVTKEVKPHALMVGNPARQIGWVSHSGERLTKDLVCKREGRHYYVNKDGFLKEGVKEKDEVAYTLKPLEC